MHDVVVLTLLEVYAEILHIKGYLVLCLSFKHILLCDLFQSHAEFNRFQKIVICIPLNLVITHLIQIFHCLVVISLLRLDSREELLFLRSPIDPKLDDAEDLVNWLISVT